MRRIEKLEISASSMRCTFLTHMDGFTYSRTCDGICKLGDGSIETNEFGYVNLAMSRSRSIPDDGSAQASSERSV